MLIGRNKEKQMLLDALASHEAQFIAVYGRRRVGKTFLIRETFNNQFSFQFTGAAKSTSRRQLARFRQALKEQGLAQVPTVLSNWLEAFSQLKCLIQSQPDGKKVIFLDELPWMDAPRSGFLSELEAFWNGWASAQSNIVLVVCGSATSWMIKKIIKNKGGLHNRLTHRLALKPFCLGECEQLVKARGIVMTRQQILQGYMIFGGIPYYWSLLNKANSLNQDVDRLIFSPDGDLHNEFDMLYAALFNHPEPYINIITALASRKSGLTRKQIIQQAGVESNGSLTNMLNDLEWCGFIRSYSMPGKNVKEQIWQLIDNYTLFYYAFINGRHQPDNYWEAIQGKPIYNTWCGLAFEKVCLQHVKQIKQKLGISGILTYEYAWQFAGDKDKEIHGAQIDLLIDRSDGVVNLCEMKYAQSLYAITEDYAQNLARKRETFMQVTRTRKAVRTVMITTNGLARNAHLADVQNQVTMNDLFAL